MIKALQACNKENGYLLLKFFFFFFFFFFFYSV